MMGVPPSEYATVLPLLERHPRTRRPRVHPRGHRPRARPHRAPARSSPHLMNELSAHRTTHPTDDLTTALITTNIDGEALTSGELASFFILLLTAGNETTRNAISHGLLALTEHPDQRAIWQADPGGIAATGVDEIVRWASPVIWMRRTVTEDTVLSGEELHPGRQGAPLLRLGQPGRGGVRRPLPLRRLRYPNPHCRLRGGRTPLLPGRPPRPPGDRRHAPRAAAPGCRTSRPPASPTGRAPASSTGSSTCPAGSLRRADRRSAHHSGLGAITHERHHQRCTRNPGPPGRPQASASTAPTLGPARDASVAGVGVGDRPAADGARRATGPPRPRPATAPTPPSPSADPGVGLAPLALRSWRSVRPPGRAPRRRPGRPS